MNLYNLKKKLAINMVAASRGYDDFSGLNRYISMLCKTYADVLLITNGSEINITAMQSRLKESLLTGVEREKQHFERLLEPRARDEKTNKKRKARDPRKKAA